MDSEKVIYPELSYKLVGIAFKIFNDVGFGMPEKFYQLAFVKELESEKLTYEREKLAIIIYFTRDGVKYKRVLNA